MDNTSENKTPNENQKPKREKRAPASERMLKAKNDNTTWLFSHKDEFLATVGKEITLLEDSSLGCAGFCLRHESSFTLAFNPEVVDNLTDDQIYGIVGHEIGRAGGWCMLEALKKKNVDIHTDL